MRSDPYESIEKITSEAPILAKDEAMTRFSCRHLSSLVLLAYFVTAAAAQEPVWMLGKPLLDETTTLEGKPVRLVDPCILRHEDRWHIFASANGGTVWTSTRDFATRPIASEVIKLPVGSCFVPQVFFHRPQSRWHLIGMMPDKTGRYPKMAPCLCTNADITNPKGWSPPEVLDVPPPQDEAKPVKLWIDFWVICDEVKVHLFVTSDGGRLWRSETTLAKYPHGWSQPVIALRGEFIYAPHVYRLDVSGRESYMLTLTARAADGHHYQQSYTAARLDAAWQPAAAMADKPFAGLANMRVEDARWSGDLSHGEPVRSSTDERMILEADFKHFIFHGAFGEGSSKEVKRQPAVGLLDRLRPE